jgi:predicted metal-binding transcription factor (methanogenesis marker protein 9)
MIWTCFQNQICYLWNLQQFDMTLPKVDYMVLFKKLKKDLIESTSLPLDQKTEKD